MGSYASYRYRKYWQAALAVACAAFGTWTASAPAHADTFPDHPVRIVVPFAAGGAVDSVARIIGDPLAARLGQPVIVENKPGNHANIGTHEVVRAQPDGYTMLLGANGLATNPWLDKNLPFNPQEDLVPVARVGYAPLVLVVDAESPYQTLQQLLQAAHDKQGKMNYGSSGVGGSGHLAVEMLKRTAGIQAMHIGYKGGVPALTDLIGGRLDFMMVNPLEAAPRVAAGNIRALAVASRQRISTLPDVPTFDEAGVPGFEATVWWGFLVPAKTPATAIDTLSKHLLAVLDDKAVQKRLAGVGAIVDTQTPAAFGESLKSETQRWGEVIKSAGITSN
ncbi:tripartite tricarboxylate transporter substrate binding protein [Bordetella sp. BOR01]|uniref:Bug family tripartite tricarboxylate transporter substrate binding protein n=1 Tax=Bordetella sp. BOR01 TaxID=2854779 RepID=UPI001C470DC1|nr:tripartite tricarboxylate transporter substrate binding protein [Bordetella sp. BOR01]MBV7486081.1 tripartite tricarboxylate transporter substrate binding protein [Bordetella sp. BOR01]